MKINILLPYKEKFDKNKASSVSITVKNNLMHTKFLNGIKVYGQNVENALFKDNFVGLNYSIFSLKSKNTFLLHRMLMMISKDNSKKQLIEIHNRPYLINQISRHYQFPVSLNDNLKNNSTNKNFNNQCFTDSCIAMNAQYNRNSHVLSWSIDSDGKLLMRVFSSQSFSDWIDQTTIKSPFAKIENSGIYGLDPSIRSAVNRVFTNKTFFRELSLFNRLKRRGNEASRFLGRHPFVFGLMVAATTYFVIPEEESQKTTPPPPSFPH